MKKTGNLSIVFLLLTMNELYVIAYANTVNAEREKIRDDDEVVEV